MARYTSSGVLARCTAGAAWLRANSRRWLRDFSSSTCTRLIAAVTCPAMSATRFVSSSIKGSRREKSIRPIGFPADTRGTTIIDWTPTSLKIFEINFLITRRDFPERRGVCVNSIIQLCMNSASLMRRGPSASSNSWDRLPSVKGMRISGMRVPISFSTRFATAG